MRQIVVGEDSIVPAPSWHKIDREDAALAYVQLNAAILGGEQPDEYGEGWEDYRQLVREFAQALTSGDGDRLDRALEDYLPALGLKLAPAWVLDLTEGM